MENQASVLDAPISANVTVMSKKRPREYLTEAEIERLMGAAKDNRHGLATRPLSWSPIVMRFDPASLSPCAGTTWTSRPTASTSGGPGRPSTDYVSNCWVRK
jgi:hypothetical protein